MRQALLIVCVSVGALQAGLIGDVIALDASGNATPITYMGRGDRQYVVVAAGGPGHLMTIGNTAEDRSDTVIAFALPK